MHIDRMIMHSYHICTHELENNIYNGQLSRTTQIIMGGGADNTPATCQASDVEYKTLFRG